MKATVLLCCFTLPRRRLFWLSKGRLLRRFPAFERLRRREGEAASRVPCFVREVSLRLHLEVRGCLGEGTAAIYEAVILAREVENTQNFVTLIIVLDLIFISRTPSACMSDCHGLGNAVTICALLDAQRLCNP